MNQIENQTQSSGQWLAEAKTLLRNPPIDTVPWPILSCIGAIGLLATALTPYGMGRTDIVWPQWHLDLIVFLAPRLAIVYALWAGVMAVTWLIDRVRGLPTITSDSPTYHRVYYVFKFGMLAFNGLALFFVFVIATVMYWEQNIVLILITATTLCAAALLYFRNWTPQKIWRMGRQQASLGSIRDMSSISLGIAYLILGVLSIIGGIFGGQSAVWVTIRLVFISMYVLVGYYGCRAFFAYSLFALTHLGLIRK